MGNLRQLSRRCSVAQQARWQREAPAHLFSDAYGCAALVAGGTTNCLSRHYTEEAVENISHLQGWRFCYRCDQRRGCIRIPSTLAPTQPNPHLLTYLTP